MGVQNLDRIFKPRRIALIGISINPKSVSGKVLRNLVGSGFRGVVYPVNATSEAVMGIPCFPTLGDLPKTPDLAVICSAASTVPGWIEACGEAGIRGIIIISAGFRETGQQGRELENQIQKLQNRYPDMRIVGPNCLGIIVPALNLNLSFAPLMPADGNIAFVSQSGALCTSVLDWAREEKIGFSTFVSLGNTLDVDFGDLIDYLGMDPNTRSMILYIESIANAKKFISAARAFARTKPIIVYKAGRYPQSAQVAASHTGAMASSDDIYDAVFQRTGIARVQGIGEIFDCVALIGRNKIPRGDRLGIVTNAGGPGVMATDALIAAGGTLARLSEKTLDSLNTFLPPMWSRQNPVDVLGDDQYKRLVKAARTVLKDPGVDAGLVILTPQAMTNITAAARAIGQLQSETSKPILASWLGGYLMDQGIRILNEHQIAAYQTPEQAIGAFMNLVSYARNLQTLYETPRDIPVEFTLDRQSIRQKFREIAKTRTPVLSEQKTKSFLQAYGIPVVLPHMSREVNEALDLAGEIGYPVVFKISSPDITHKSDAGGVKLGIRNQRQARSAYREILSTVKKRHPRASIEGITVQSMVDPPDAIELILGIKQDPTFGTVILAGAGGITAELLKDRSLGLPPLNERLARRMLEQLKIWPLLQGYRGRQPVDLDRLIEVIIRLSYLAADYPQIRELDINPLLVSGDRLIVLDARMILAEDSPRLPAEKYAHLSIRPYPEEYIAPPVSLEGKRVVFRPIRPEDEPMWLKMLASCSRESIYSRFNYLFQWNSHEVATRFCYIDYDREMAIVAEVEEENHHRELVAVGRLIADVEHETVEYAILVIDHWQNRELGTRLTQYCMKIAERWGLKRIVAQTTARNRRVIRLLRNQGFAITHDPDNSTVFAEKKIRL